MARRQIFFTRVGPSREGSPSERMCSSSKSFELGLLQLRDPEQRRAALDVASNAVAQQDEASRLEPMWAAVPQWTLIEQCLHLVDDLLVGLADQPCIDPRTAPVIEIS